MTAEQQPMQVFPFKPRDWVADGNGRVARVKSVYEGNPGEVLLDLVLYDRNGNVTGRESPVMGGPRTFEPACPSDGWHRIKEAIFPTELRWVEKNGRKTARYWAGEPLPPANWKKPGRKSRSRVILQFDNEKHREALTKIADGHNDARKLAAQALGR